MRPIAILALLGPILLDTAPAHADPQALSSNVPVQIEDALPTAYGHLTLQNDDRYTRDPHGHGRDTLTLNPVVKFSPLRGLQLDVSTPYSVGDKGSASQGSGTLDALYQFNQDSGYIPAFAVHGYYISPYGAGHKSGQYTLRGIATKSLGNDVTAPRLHLNLTLYHLTQPSRTQRSDQLEIGLGYSALLSQTTAIVTDVIHGAKPDKKANQTFLDVGLRHEISASWAVGAGVGAGIAQESPSFRVFFSLQKDFTLF